MHKQIFICALHLSQGNFDRSVSTILVPGFNVLQALLYRKLFDWEHIICSDFTFDYEFEFLVKFLEIKLLSTKLHEEIQSISNRQHRVVWTWKEGSLHITNISRWRYQAIHPSSALCCIEMHHSNGRHPFAALNNKILCSYNQPKGAIVQQYWLDLYSSLCNCKRLCVGRRQHRLAVR